MRNLTTVTPSIANPTLRYKQSSNIWAVKGVFIYSHTQWWLDYIQYYSFSDIAVLRHEYSSAPKSIVASPSGAKAMEPS